jgi:UDP-N-acetylglucosamine 1-carboxyvinyltransferase
MMNDAASAAMTARRCRANDASVARSSSAQPASFVDRIYHLDRGYDRMERRLSTLGARIERLK